MDYGGASQKTYKTKVRTADFCPGLGATPMKLSQCLSNPCPTLAKDPLLVCHETSLEAY